MSHISSLINDVNNGHVTHDFVKMNEEEQLYLYVNHFIYITKTNYYFLQILLKY